MRESVVIVGAGIAGLHTAIKLKEKYPETDILVLEKYDKPGGRMETITLDKNTHYESGAGRLHSTHTKLLELIKKYKLTTIALPDESYWKIPSAPLEPNPFFNIWIELCNLFATLPEETLQTKTLRYICIETLGPEFAKSLLDKYPYRAEIEVMSASSAIDLYKSFIPGHFSVLKEGYSTLVDLIRKDAIKSGIKFKFNQTINRIEFQGKYTVSGVANEKLVTYTADRVILAVHKNALEKIYPFSPVHPLLQKVRMEPLLRVYSKYKDSSWFPDKNVITDTPLRYIIPVNKASGIIMSSYLDSRDIEPWGDLYKKANAEKMAEKIRSETQDLFPEKNIPKSEFTKSYYWADGCSYWLPGNYDYKEASKTALKPMPHDFPCLHLVGESFSKKQQWIEGALEHADELVNSL